MFVFPQSHTEAHREEKNQLAENLQHRDESAKRLPIKSEFIIRKMSLM